LLVYNFSMDDRIYNLNNSIEIRKYLRSNMTEQERILWSVIKNKRLGFKFRRQYGIGRYVVDFFCNEKNLIVELDGSQHLDNKNYDDDRTKFFEELNLRVLRFWNNEVNTNLNGVLMTIEEELNSPPRLEDSPPLLG